MKRTISNYAFNAALKTVTFTDFASIRLESILLITNVTRNIVIYQLTGTGMGGTVATNVLTLASSTTGQADTDKLNIIFEDFVSGGVVSVANSTATNLALNAVFTGASEDILPYSNIKVSIFSSHASATDGLQIQQSSNNVDWDSSDTYTIPAATNRSFSVPVNLRFFRIVYTNGATATTSLRLQVIFSAQDKQPSSVRPQDGRSNDNDFVEVLSSLMGYNSLTNAWNRIGITNATTGGNENLVDRIKVNAALRMIDNAQPSGSKLVNVTGTQALGLDVNVKNTSLPVTGTFFQATQPVSGTFFQTTQPVSIATNTPDVTDRAARLLGVVTPIAITKSIQGTTGFTTQDLKDAGRNQVHYYTVIPVLTSATDTLQSLTGTKAGVTVAATTTPAVVTTGKIQRITRIAATYVATAASGYGIVRLRYNTAGVVAITSPIAATLLVGAGAPTTANSTASVESILDEGWEFAAATGIGISVQGFAAVTPTAVGYVLVAITGYEY